MFLSSSTHKSFPKQQTAVDGGLHLQLFSESAIIPSGVYF